ncbi:PTR2-domain-containing protein [Mrakia frigida]|uniref:PTR2-domain-containing protein n=1 Tax=Mrakia frigida TaxID=29902 RepID=UPI003FCC0686
MANQQIIYETAAGGEDLKGVLSTDIDEKGSINEKGVAFGATRSAEDEFGDEDGRAPTEEERHTLRLVAAHIPWTAFIICLVEFAERASYYGCSGLFNNFIQRPLPEGGNGAGATPKGSQLTPGALGLGLQAASGLTKCFQFLAYTIPILGGIIADTKWGKFKTICVGTFVGFVAHVVLVIAAIPSVIATGHAIAPFVISIIILAFATGFIKACIAPLIADQSPVKRQQIKTLPSGEKVIVDPGITIQSMLLVYYWSVNIGAFTQIATSYAEKLVGFWLAWLIPGIIYMIMPLCLWYVRHRLIFIPPQGSVVLDALKVIKTVFSGAGMKRLFARGADAKDNFWNVAKPSNLAQTGQLDVKGAAWYSWDDDFVDELRRTAQACKLFMWAPIFHLAAGGLDSIVNSMGGAMVTDGVPNDLFGNFNPLSLIVLIPIMNYGVYPFLRKHHINFSPVRRIVFGFLLATCGMIYGAILQWKVYESSPCGYNASDCDIGTTVSPLRIWLQVPLFVIPAAAEIFINITMYEVSYTRAPQRMKGLVFAIVLFMSAISAAITLIITPAFSDPNLIWPFVGVAGACFVSAILIYIFFRDMDDNEGEVVAIGTDRKIEGMDSGTTTFEDPEAARRKD